MQYPPSRNALPSEEEDVRKNKFKKDSNYGWMRWDRNSQDQQFCKKQLEVKNLVTGFFSLNSS